MAKLLLFAFLALAFATSMNDFSDSSSEEVPMKRALPGPCGRLIGKTVRLSAGNRNVKHFFFNALMAPSSGPATLWKVLPGVQRPLVALGQFGIRPYPPKACTVRFQSAVRWTGHYLRHSFFNLIMTPIPFPQGKVDSSWYVYRVRGGYKFRSVNWPSYWLGITLNNVVIKKHPTVFGVKPVGGPKPKPKPYRPIGGAVDKYGCKTAAGFRYCRALKKCLQPWTKLYRTKCRNPRPMPPSSRFKIPPRSIWHYAPWGGNCIALYQKGKLIVRRTNKKNNKGTRVWKLGRKDVKRLKQGRVVKLLWDNVAYLKARFTRKNRITVFHGKLGNKPYHFNRVK